jgi:osmotically-inducible protein OsmY
MEGKGGRGTAAGKDMAMTALREQDSRIKRSVLDALRRDALVDETEVGVEVDDGVVTLTGTVHDPRKKAAAQDAAHRAARVRDVANEIRVLLPWSPVRSDAEVARSVRRALERDVLVPADDIQTTVSGGTVTLSGVVDHWSERDDAERVARYLHGVSTVLNLIAVRSAHDPRSATLQAAVATTRPCQRDPGSVRVDWIARDAIPPPGRGAQHS